MDYFSNSTLMSDRDAVTPASEEVSYPALLMAFPSTLAESRILAMGAELDVLVSADEAAWKEYQDLEETVPYLLASLDERPVRSAFPTLNDHLKADHRWKAQRAAIREEQKVLEKRTGLLAAEEAASATSAALYARTADLAALKATSLRELVFKAQFLTGDREALIDSILGDLETMARYWPRHGRHRTYAV